MRLGWIRDERGLDPRGLIYRKVCLWGDSFCSFQERIRQPAKGFHLVSGESVSHSVVSILFDSMNCNHRVPLSMEFSRQEYWRGLPFPSPGDLPEPGIKPECLVSPASQAVGESLYLPRHLLCARLHVRRGAPSQGLGWFCFCDFHLRQLMGTLGRVRGDGE